ncbi:MAG: phytanoyl-CoA dioxygenase family protein [SAR324 cluster bacterium]|nr:phytanoyl-CoA dioxygenase family protein [SAR324 cluster bacterium]
MKVENQFHDLKSDGFTILKKIIPKSAINNLKENIYQSTFSNKMKSPDKILFVANLFKHNQSIAKYLLNTKLTNLIKLCLGEHHKISFVSSIINEPGTSRGKWHTDWPFNRHNAGHIDSPYPDAIMHITTVWMLSEFSHENGGTLILPKSHKNSFNPTSYSKDPILLNLDNEMNVTGDPGDVLVFDSRLWHATASNLTNDPRISVIIRFAPWWLNLDVLKPGSRQRKFLLNSTKLPENVIPLFTKSEFNNLPDKIKPLMIQYLNM